MNKNEEWSWPDKGSTDPVDFAAAVEHFSPNTYQARQATEHRESRRVPNESKGLRRLPSFKDIAKIGAAGLAAVTVTAGVASEIKKSNNEWALDNELSQPLPKVEQDLATGKIDRRKVVVVKSNGTYSTAWAASEAITHNDTDPDIDIRELADLVEGQTEGQGVNKGEALILPKGDVKDQ